MMENYSRKKLCEVLTNVLGETINETEISDTTELDKDLGLDSVTLIELLVDLEDMYGIEFKDDELMMELFFNINSLEEIVKKHLLDRR